MPREVLTDNVETVVIDRDGYGPGRHRFYAGFLDFAGPCGFRPRLCRPYRAQTKGKVERFIRYVRASFYVPFVSRLKPDGVVIDAAAASAAVRRWLREVANARIHATTKAVPAERLAGERETLQPIPRPYGGEVVRAEPRPVAIPIVGLQHPCRPTTS